MSIKLSQIISTGFEALVLYLESKPLILWIKLGTYVIIGSASISLLSATLAPAWRRLKWKPNANLLTGKVAIVTGGSNAIGKGVALGLAEAGATVYVTDKGIPEPGTLNETAVQVNGLGGKGIAVVCDHSKEEDISGLFDRVLREQGKIDILVNNIFTEYPIAEPAHFWENGAQFWEPVMNTGLLGHFIGCCHAAKTMTSQKSGTIINITASKFHSYPLSFSVAMAALDKLTAETAKDLKPFNVACIELSPGLVRSDQHTSNNVLEKRRIDINECGENPIYTGRAVASLCADPNMLKMTGKVITTDEAAKKYGFTDTDGRQPPPVDSWRFTADQCLRKLERLLRWQ